MTKQAVSKGASATAEARRHKILFDHTWVLATVLATALAVVTWYFGLALLDIRPVIWLLAALAAVQLVVGLAARRAHSVERLRRFALASQLLGTVLMGLTWHSFGGLQQPLFPLLIVLPLLPGSLLFNFWQQQLATAALLVLLLSGVLLSADTNSFIEARYGIGIGPMSWLPAWLPRSRLVFVDVSTSPSYNLMLVLSLAVVTVAASAAARALVTACQRGGEHLASVAEEAQRLQELNTQLVRAAPVSQILVMVSSGRILAASGRFLQTFAVQNAPGAFLLDTIAFTYPSVVKQLIADGGEDIQTALVRGQELALRMTVSALGAGAASLALVSIEPCHEEYWKGAVDSLEEPLFAVDAGGRVACLNRAAMTLFGAAQGCAATELFETDSARWWDIAPLQSARRVLNRGGRRYLASIRRVRIAASVGDLSFVRLHERESSHASAIA